MLDRRHLLQGALAAGALASTRAFAQDYPNRPLRLVVPYGAGATLDTVARVVGQEMAVLLGQPVVVENKPGANAIIGFEHVAKQAPADGYTFAIAAVSGLATLPLTVKSLRFDPLADLPPLIGLVEGKYILVSSAKLPTRTFAEFVAHAKANPGKLNYGASSTTVRLQTEALLGALGLQVTHVPYKSGGQYIQAIATGEIQLGFLAEGSALTIADRSRVIAVTGPKRSENFRDVPTFDELGLPDIRGVSYSLNARAGTPREATERLEAAAAQALQRPPVRQQLMKMALDPVAQPAEAAAKRLAEEARAFREVARKAGIEPV